MQLTKAEERQWNFKGIPEGHAEHFARLVLGDYELSVDDGVLYVPNENPYYSEEFIDGFDDSFRMFESSVEWDLFPDIDWDELSEEEQDEKRHMVQEETFNRDDEYIQDVRKVLDTHQLFYVLLEFIYLFQEFQVKEYVNSPLQEVW